MDNSKSEANNRKFRLQHWHQVMLFLVAYDMVAVSAAYLFGLLLRFDFRFSMIDAAYYDRWLRFAPIYAVICVAVFAGLKLYRSIWRFASFNELKRITIATLITAVLHVAGISLLFGSMPRSYYIAGPIIQFALVTAVRFSYRFVLLLRGSRAQKDAERVMIVGAGAAGQMLQHDLKSSGMLNEKLVCFIDDNRNKWNRDIEGVPVVSGRESIPDIAERKNIDKIYIAMPSASARERKKIINICRETDCEVMTLPGMYQLALGDVTVNSLKKVDVEDLLGRDPVKLNSSEVWDYLVGRTVLVTGGGGSIGSELCRQVAAVPGLRRLVIFDMYENNAHQIEMELLDRYPYLDLKVLIGSVRNSRRVRQVFRDYRPDIVLHAAAHKHVPLMELSPCEAVKNNVAGTYYTALAAMEFGAEKFVLISTDKAVNPVNIMGASKRLCEMVIQTFALMSAQGRARELPDLQVNTDGDSDDIWPVDMPEHPRTEFTAVRFGNVLGSNGSVIPRFREQIAKGGPVTVTHPDIIRYFMTIPEASSLVLEAAMMGSGGRIMVLDMGTPVKIDDLARDMIRLSGLKPDVDIKIEYTGLRPGEKLYEERLMAEEGLSKTNNDLISIGRPIEFNEDRFLKQVVRITQAAFDDDEKHIRELVAEAVGNYSYKE